MRSRLFTATTDFFTVSTSAFGALNCFFVIARDRQRILPWMSKGAAAQSSARRFRGRVANSIDLNGKTRQTMKQAGNVTTCANTCLAVPIDSVSEATIQMCRLGLRCACPAPLPWFPYPLPHRLVSTWSPSCRLRSTKGGGAMMCPSCGSGRLRPSKLRFADFPHLMFLRFPVRCPVCTSRLFVGFRVSRSVRRHSHGKQT